MKESADEPGTIYTLMERFEKQSFRDYLSLRKGSTRANA